MAQKIEFRAAVHTPLDQRQEVQLPLDRSVAPRPGDGREDSGFVLPQLSNKAMSSLAAVAASHSFKVGGTRSQPRTLFLLLRHIRPPSNDRVGRQAEHPVMRAIVVRHNELWPKTAWQLENKPIKKVDSHPWT